MDISQRLREFRISQKLTQEQFGAHIGYTIRTIQSWETGGHLPGSYAIASIAAQFNVSADYLLCLTDTPRPPAN